MSDVKLIKAILKHLLLLPLFFILLSCSDDSNESNEEMQQKQIVVLFSPGGLGDNGYNDLIMKGLQRVLVKRQDADMLIYSPHSIEEAERIFGDWMNLRSKGKPCLFVLASSEYEPMAVRELKGNTRDMSFKNVLLFESANESGLGLGEAVDHGEPIYTFKIEMYGASYLAGVTAAAITDHEVLALLSNSTDMVIAAAGYGFRDGYRAATGQEASVQYMYEDWHGYTMSEEAYQMMPQFSKQYGFIFPVAGGTNMGIYRYLREHPDGPLVTGMDVDQSIYTSCMVGSVIKRIDLLVERYLTDWLDGKEQDPHPVYGLESGYADWILSPAYKAELSDVVEAHRQEAIRKENQIIEEYK